MEELFLKTEYGNLPINGEIVQKYHLKQGEKSPFGGYRITDKNGGAQPVPEHEKPPMVFEDHPQILTTTEVLDFMQASDSSES